MSAQGAPTTRGHNHFERLGRKKKPLSVLRLAGFTFIFTHCHAFQPKFGNGAYRSASASIRRASRAQRQLCQRRFQGE